MNILEVSAMDVFPALRRINRKKYVCSNVCKRADIRIMFMGDDSGIKGYDSRILELSNAPLHFTKDTTIIE